MDESAALELMSEDDTQTSDQTREERPGQSQSQRQMLKFYQKNQLLWKEKRQMELMLMRMRK